MIPYLEMTTKNGDAVKLTTIDDDISIPAVFPAMKDKLPLIRDATGRVGDILLCSYPKSGTHWMGNLIGKMLQTKMDDLEKETFKDRKPGLLELAPLEAFENAVSPRLIPTHLRPNRIPSYFLQGKGKVVLVLRNPKDVAVSFFYHLRNAKIVSNKQDWQEYFECFRNGTVPFRSCLDYIKAWEAEIKINKDLDIEYIYYEDLKTNGLDCARRLAKHLGLALTDEELQSILDACSLKNLKEEDSKDRSEKQRLLLNKDGESVIYRKGEVADWKNHFTVAQNEVYDEQINHALDGCMFKFRFE